MTIKTLETKLKEVKLLEKRLKLMEDLKALLQKMNKLNSCYDLNEILMNEPKFNDDFYNETIKVIEYLKESISLQLE